ncbi:hypothetical protein GCM10010271_68880 [Streptomyces kurssanovii]|nr:hypothetical protein GCM10010271_68880 [Streptomyces kurssanovii]
MGGAAGRGGSAVLGGAEPGETGGVAVVSSGVRAAASHTASARVRVSALSVMTVPSAASTRSKASGTRKLAHQEIVQFNALLTTGGRVASEQGHGIQELVDG